MTAPKPGPTGWGEAFNAGIGEGLRRATVGDLLDELRRRDPRLVNDRPLPEIHYESSLPSELDEFFAELLDRTEGIGGSCLLLDNGTEVWLHTEGRVKTWLREAMEAWKSGEYATPEAEPEPITLNPDFFTGQS